MFKKVLIAEDMDSVNNAVMDLLKQMGISEIDHSQYCDEAYLKCKKAMQDDLPYQLLICDLSFKQDHRKENIPSGEALAELLKRELPDLRVIIHSVEDQANLVKRLWESGNIDAYVCKDRHGMRDLKEAVENVSQGKTYNSPKIANALKKKNLIELSDYELSLLELLTKGFNQEEIHQQFKQEGKNPYSKSAIEKKLKDLRVDFNARSNPQLISIAKDLHLI